MDEEQFQELKLKKLPYKEFQQTDQYKELIESLYNSYPYLPYINISLIFYAWYVEMVLEEKLPDTEPEEPIVGEITGIEVYDKVDYSLKYYDILEQEKKFELTPMTEDEYLESQKLENRIESI